MAGRGERVGHHADHVGEEDEEEEREDEGEEFEAFLASGAAHHVGDEAIADFGQRLQARRHELALRRGKAEECDCQDDAERHEAGRVRERQVDTADIEVEPFRDLELVDGIQRNAWHKQVHPS